MTRVAIIDAFSGVAGDMMLGAMVGVGMSKEWLRALPASLRLDGVDVRIQEVLRADIACWKVDFDIPPQPHGRHIRQIRELVAAADVPDAVRDRADRVFTGIATAEAEIHGVTPDDVHLHEVGAVDAILDVVGVVWGLSELGVDQVHCGAITLGDGTVKAAHGELPVPAPATLRLLEGHAVRPGPPGSGELVTPTGAALVRVLSSGPPPTEFVPRRTGYGAGTKDFKGRANAVRLTLADLSSADPGYQSLIELAAEIDDMSPEYVAGAAERLRAAGALDVVLVPVTMKRGRAGVRIEALCAEDTAAHLENVLLAESSSIGVRRRRVERRALPRSMRTVEVLGHPIAVKVVELPGGGRQAKPEYVDVERVALATSHSLQDIYRLAATAAERL
jgi:uncharacterized protein (TIGR00299 family) protein